MLAIGRLLFGTTVGLANGRLRSPLVRGVVALATGSALLAATAARADDPRITTLLATGGVYGGMSQATATCYAFNAGTTRVSVLALTIFNQVGTSVGTTSCPALARGTLCAVSTPIVNTVAYSCTLTSKSPNADDLRGVLDFRDIYQNVLINSNLH
jgi:hypothetical protein